MCSARTEIDMKDSKQRGFEFTLVVRTILQQWDEGTKSRPMAAFLPRQPLPLPPPSQTGVDLRGVYPKASQIGADFEVMMSADESTKKSKGSNPKIVSWRQQSEA